jgi:hypothetical protein
VGQRIEVRPTVVGDAAIFDTDRSITGQDGTSYTSPEEAADDRRFPGKLANELFATDEMTKSVWIASNTVVVTRDTGWPDPVLEAATNTISTFFLHY